MLYLLELKLSNRALAVAEARAVGEPVEESGAAAVVRDPSVTRNLAMSHYVSRLVCSSDAAVGAVVDAVRDSGYAPEGGFAVRARVHDAEVSSEDIEREVGGVLDGGSAEVDLDSPDTVVRVVVSGDRAYVGELVCETEGFEGRAPTEKPFFKPGSMSPMLARALSNIAGGYDDACLLDPTCGTGGVLVESAMTGGSVHGVDVSREMVEGARTNLEEYAPSSWSDLAVGDARSLPFSDDSFDGAVSDLPYGRASLVEGERGELATAVVADLGRVVRAGGRIVVVADRDLDIDGAAVGTVERIEDRVHRSLTRHIHVLRVE